MTPEEKLITNTLSFTLKQIEDLAKALGSLAAITQDIARAVDRLEKQVEGLEHEIFNRDPIEAGTAN